MYSQEMFHVHEQWKNFWHLFFSTLVNSHESWLEYCVYIHVYIFSYFTSGVVKQPCRFLGHWLLYTQILFSFRKLRSSTSSWRIIEFSSWNEAVCSPHSQGFVSLLWASGARVEKVSTFLRGSTSWDGWSVHDTFKCRHIHRGFMKTPRPRLREWHKDEPSVYMYIFSYTLKIFHFQDFANLFLFTQALFVFIQQTVGNPQFPAS